MFRQSVPGSSSSPKALGVPVAFITHNVASMTPIKMQYSLVTAHLINTGSVATLAPLDIKNKVHKVAEEVRERAQCNYRETLQEIHAN